MLGPVVAWDDAGTPLDLKGPRHRAVLARLAVARGRVVPLSVLIDDLWDVPPAGAAGAVRTFVGALRQGIEPARPPRTLVTQGPGYVLRISNDNCDAPEFERLAAESAAAPPERALELADEAIGLWRGPAYAEFADEPWAAPERARLTELRLRLTEQQAGTRLALGRAADAVPGLSAHVEEHPWREEAWRLLALALYRGGRQAEALTVIRRARALIADEHGLDPGPALGALEQDILRRAPHLDLPVSDRPVGDVLAVTASVYERTTPGFARTRLETAATLAGSLALAGGEGLRAAMDQRLAAIEAAEKLGDPEFTGRVIGNFAVPAIWTRSDDPAAAAAIVAAAERVLFALPPGGHDALRARLLGTIALESRGTSAARPREAAAEAESIARRLADPALLAFTLNGAWMQAFWRTGLAARRDGIGREIVTLASRHGLPEFEILGRLIRLQALSALADVTAADAQAATLDDLSARHERPLVAVFTGWYRAMRSPAETGYRAAADLLADCGMPGVADGLLPLALLCLRAWRGEAVGNGFPADTGWGPYEPWARPWVLLAQGRRDEARDAVEACPAPSPGLLTEALLCLHVRAAQAVGDSSLACQARGSLAPAAGEIAAGSGLLTAGPVRDYL